MRASHSHGRYLGVAAVPASLSGLPPAPTDLAPASPGTCVVLAAEGTHLRAGWARRLCVRSFPRGRTFGVDVLLAQDYIFEYVGVLRFIVHTDSAGDGAGRVCAGSVLMR